MQLPVLGLLLSTKFGDYVFQLRNSNRAKDGAQLSSIFTACGIPWDQSSTARKKFCMLRYAQNPTRKVNNVVECMSTIL